MPELELELLGTPWDGGPGDRVVFFVSPDRVPEDAHTYTVPWGRWDELGQPHTLRLILEPRETLKGP